ncbi:Receptor-interacting serine/threonine-protein kinase 2 [Bagarius yarrelli]|uniref:Receptor-interacting serine/threonine-protein kinase 2 n=1 Tax=Bagarius yarrelli TaxID=175774 RepID=A0A556VCN7_BAGYA|nr:Receptor-interacting serine/threonine-protein kinase 2 [Bagarius yarrelli]
MFDEAELINVALVGCSGGACLRGHLKTSARAVALKLLARTGDCLSQMQDVLVKGGVCVKRVLQPVGLDQFQNLIAFTQKGASPATERNLLPPETPQSPALSRLMTRCWSVDAKLRPLAKECVLELRKVLEGLNSGADDRAVHLIKAHKERALLSCKHTQVWELPVELNNLERFSGCTRPKHLKSKSVSVMAPPAHTHRSPARKPDETYPRGSPPSAAVAWASPPAGCCRDAARRCAEVCDVKATRVSPPAHTPCGSPTSLTHTPLHPANQPMCPVSSGRTCCQLLQERREVIVRSMTEGRLNNLLDVLRARRAVTREHYELITASMTLSARTRCLLDTCTCLGEKAAVLVATTLGLVSMGMTQEHAHSQISPEGKAG